MTQTISAREYDVDDDLQLLVVSFGFGHDRPAPAADLVLDLREWFRDPHVDPALRTLTGLDHAVVINVLGTRGVGAFVERLYGVVEALLGLDAGTVVVAAGCVGGRHRSVVVADVLACRARSAGWRAQAVHRDVELPVLASSRR